MTASGAAQPQPTPAQGTLLDLKQPRRRKAGVEPVSAHLPIARVWLDLSAPHLDQEYDYLVPAAWDAAAQPGVRIRVRFGQQEVPGFVVARLASTEHAGPLQPLRRVVSEEVVLTAPIRELVRLVARRWAGTTADVLRLAVPPRHARTEKQIPSPPASPTSDAEPPPAWNSIWEPYQGGAAFLNRITTGDAPRAVWTPLPGLAPDPAAATPVWAAAIAMVAQTAKRAGRGVLIVAPDARDVRRLTSALATAGLASVQLLAEVGPAQRYRAFLAASRGEADVVVGTRAAAFAPMAHLGLIVLWGDGEEPLQEPLAPYPNARDVLCLRATLEQAALLVGSPSRTLAAQYLIASGWAAELVAGREATRIAGPLPRALTSPELAAEGAGAAARLPGPAVRAVRKALAAGPVLVQVPRTGYLPIVACARCHQPATCTRCHGPLRLEAAGAVADCRWCAQLAGGWRCPECGSERLRAIRIGAERTAEELGRAFPGTPVRVSATSAASGVLDTVPNRAALIVATPGAEPVAIGGYATCLLLDAAASTGGTDLAAGTRALHRWLAAAGLVRPASAGGQVLLVGDGAPGPTTALVRADPGWFAERELAERAQLQLPPTVALATLTGDRLAVTTFAAQLTVPTEQFGPVPVEESAGDPPPAQAALFTEPQVRLTLRVPLRAGLDLAQALKAGLAVRSARREGGRLRVHMWAEEI